MFSLCSANYQPAVGWFIQPFSYKYIGKTCHTTLKTNFTTKSAVEQYEHANSSTANLPEAKGITLQSLIDCALEMYVPHPGIETEKKATEMLKEELLDILSDVNVSMLEVAAFSVQEQAEKGQIPGLTQERFRGRPGPVADEILGLAIATYIGGTRGVFEYVRFDQAKPGILKHIGFLNKRRYRCFSCGCICKRLYACRAERRHKTVKCIVFVQFQSRQR